MKRSRLPQSHAGTSILNALCNKSAHFDGLDGLESFRSSMGIDIPISFRVNYSGKDRRAVASNDSFLPYRITLERYLELDANTPWYKSRFVPGLGTSTASVSKSVCDVSAIASVPSFRALFGFSRIFPFSGMLNRSSNTELWRSNARYAPVARDRFGG